MIQRFIKKIFKPLVNFNVLKAEQHGLSYQRIPSGALAVLETLQDEGFEAFIVGGAVRDLLLNKSPKDFDIATNALPQQVKRLFRRAYIIGRRFRIVHVHMNGELIEVTTFRGANTAANHVDEHGRILSDNAFGSHLEDASRRDFTINALFYDPSDNTVWDAYDGYRDLQKKRLRLIGKASTRFREDPVRILRILRFSAKLDFKIDVATKNAAKQLSHLLDMVPSARLADEFAKFLMGGYSEPGLQELANWQLLNRFLHNVSDKETITPLMHRALQKADCRHAAQKGLSLSFLMAALLWSSVEKWEQTFREKGLPPTVAMQDSINETIHLQQQKVFLTKAIVGDMRDLWYLQSTLLFPRPRQISRLLRQHKLTSAIDFLELRSPTNQVEPPNINVESLATLKYPIFSTVLGNDSDCIFWAHWWRKMLSLPYNQQDILVKHWLNASQEAKNTSKHPPSNKRSRPHKA